MLMMLPTNRALRAGLADLPALRAPHAPDWGLLLHAGPSSFKLLYSLQIVDAMLLQDESAPPVPAPAAAPADENAAPPDPAGASDAPAPWTTSFVDHGGVAHLVSLLSSPGVSRLDTARGSQRKPCVVLLLRLLSHLLLRDAAAAAPPLEPTPPSLELTPPSAAPSADWRPPWATRTFSTLRGGAIAAVARGADFTTTLMTFVEVVAARAADDGGSAPPALLPGEIPQLERTATPAAAAVESDAALDVAIVREALQLIVGCARSEAAALRALSAEATLLSWLKGILLGCKSAMVRREVAAAVYALGCDAPDLMLEGDGDPKPVRAPVALCLQNLLPSVRDVVSRGGQGATREYFELTHAMVARVLRDAPAARTAALPAEGGGARGLLRLGKALAKLAQLHLSPIEKRDNPELVDVPRVGYYRLLQLVVLAGNGSSAAAAARRWRRRSARASAATATTTAAAAAATSSTICSSRRPPTTRGASARARRRSASRPSAAPPASASSSR